MENHRLKRVSALLYILVLTIFRQVQSFDEEIIQNVLSPVEITNNMHKTVWLDCFEKQYDRGVPIKQNVVFDQIKAHASIEVGRGLLDFEDNLFCDFEYEIREWNCAIKYVINYMCIWEHPHARLMRHEDANFNDDNCPICEQGPSPDTYLCRWNIERDGLYVSQFHPFSGRHQYKLFKQWKEDEDHHEFLSEYRVSIFNDLDDELLLTFGVMDAPMNTVKIPGRLRAHISERFFYISLNPRTDERLLSSPWICKFKDLGSMAYRRDVKIWKPPLVNHVSMPIDCIDCAWKADNEGIWLDRVGCGQTASIWEKRFDWVPIRKRTREPDDDDQPPKRPKLEHLDL